MAQPVCRSESSPVDGEGRGHFLPALHPHATSTLERKDSRTADKVSRGTTHPEVPAVAGVSGGGHRLQIDTARDRTPTRERKK